MGSIEEHYSELVLRNEQKVSYSIFNYLTDTWDEKKNVTFYDMIVDYRNALMINGIVKIRSE